LNEAFLLEVPVVAKTYRELTEISQTGCNMSFYGISQNAAYFHRPGDFCPERFMPNPPAEFQ